MGYLQLLFELYENFYKMEKRTNQSLNFTEFQEKLLQQLTQEEATKKRLDK